MRNPSNKKGEWTASVWISAFFGIVFIALGAVLIQKDQQIQKIGPINIRSGQTPNVQPTGDASNTPTPLHDETENNVNR